MWTVPIVKVLTRFLTRCLTGFLTSFLTRTGTRTVRTRTRTVRIRTRTVRIFVYFLLFSYLAESRNSVSGPGPVKSISSKAEEFTENLLENTACQVPFL